MRNKNSYGLELYLEDSEWPLTYIDHDRVIVRAIVYDDEGYFYFNQMDREDEFGKAVYIETAGGGVEFGEDLETAIHRELKEELGADVDIVCTLGVVQDAYHLIHRRNINHYFLCKVSAFGETQRTQDEIERYHMSALKLTYEDAIWQYENSKRTKIGRLVAQRELPVLYHAKKWMREAMELKYKFFDALTTKELYEILRVRAEVFVVEQTCVYQDLDGIDDRSLHLYYEEDGKIPAYMRAFIKEEGVVQVGRVLTVEHGKGLGGKLLHEGLQVIRDIYQPKKIYIEAQCYAIGYYAREGFEVCSEEFLEDGIPHVQMELKF